MILHLDNENISDSTNNEINVIAKNNVLNFSDFISKASKKYENNLDWHLCSPLSRNPITSDFFYNICKIIYVKDLSKNEKIEIVYVDNYYLKKNLDLIFKEKKIKIINLNRFENPIYFFLKKVNFFVKKLTFKLFQILLCKLLIKDKTLNNIILIEKFVAKDLFEYDRYYGDLINLSSREIKERIYYLPFIILTNFINIIPVYLKIRKFTNHICKEKYISFFDVIYSCLFCFRIHKYKLNNIYYNDLNITPLFNGELLDAKGCDLAIEGIINYLFFKNIKQRNIKMDLIIDWWENQACDKGFSLGVKKYFSEINFISYLGYVPRNMEFHLSPTKYEIKMGLVSNNISIIGKKFAPNIKILNKDINLIYSPSFRFHYLWKHKLEEIIKKRKTNIYLVLPIIYNQSKNIINKALEFKNKYNQHKIYYKQHPSLRNKQKKYLEKIINNNFYPINKNNNFLLSLNSKDIVITSHSSAALEAISLGIPIVILYDRNSLYFDPIPSNLLNYKYSSKNFKEFENTISNILKINNNNLSNNHNIKDDYFIKPTIHSTQNFFNQCYKSIN